MLSQVSCIHGDSFRLNFCDVWMQKNTAGCTECVSQSWVSDPFQPLLPALLPGLSLTTHRSVFSFLLFPPTLSPFQDTFTECGLHGKLGNRSQAIS